MIHLKIVRLAVVEALGDVPRNCYVAPDVVKLPDDFFVPVVRVAGVFPLFIGADTTVKVKVAECRDR